MDITAVGIDIVKVARLQAALDTGKDHFLEETFSPAERSYCTSFANPAVHFAGTFAVKEAVRKATGEFLPMHEVEVLRTKEGRPEVWTKGVRMETLHISISHTDTDAVAIAIKTN